MNHDYLVRLLVTDIVNHGGINIAVDLPGFTPPEKIVWKGTGQGHIPDVTATLFGSNFVFEVETDDSVLNDHTHAQLQLFGTYADEYQGVCCLVVPSICYFRAMVAVMKARKPIQIVRY